MRLSLVIMAAALVAVSCFGQATETPTPTNTPTPTPTAVVRSVPASSVVTVGTASTTVSNRMAFDRCWLVNGGNETVYLNLIGGVAEVSKGYALASGASLLIDNSFAINSDMLFRSVITAISTGGGDALFITMTD